MIDYCQKNKSGCIVARQILSSLNINDGFVPLEKPFKLQVCFAFKKNNSKTETMHTFMDYVQSESPPRFIKKVNKNPPYTFLGVRGFCYIYNTTQFHHC